MITKEDVSWAQKEKGDPEERSETFSRRRSDGVTGVRGQADGQGQWLEPGQTA